MRGACARLWTNAAQVVTCALIENNDAYAVGAYGGVSSERDTLVLISRWQEILSTT